jgi:hypothetical protein
MTLQRTKKIWKRRSDAKRGKNIVEMMNNEDNLRA